MTMLRKISEPIFRFTSVLSRANTNNMIAQSSASSKSSSLYNCCSNNKNTSSLLNPTDNILCTPSVRNFHQSSCLSNYIVKFEKRKEIRPPPPKDETPHLPDHVNQDVFNQEDTEETKRISYETIEKINEQIRDRSHGRLFAVVQIGGKQFKITPEDIIIVQGYWAPTIGDRIRMEKVLLTGGLDFTLLGRPTLPRDLVRIEGTVIEKTLSYTKLHFVLKKRKNYRRMNFYKTPYTMVRINSIEFDGLVNERKDVEGQRNTILNIM